MNDHNEWISFALGHVRTGTKIVSANTLTLAQSSNFRFHENSPS